MHQISDGTVIWWAKTNQFIESSLVSNSGLIVKLPSVSESFDNMSPNLDYRRLHTHARAHTHINTNTAEFVLRLIF